jgi:hypothetical protein
VKNIPFTEPKARLVAALPVGAEFETRRPIGGEPEKVERDVVGWVGTFLDYTGHTALEHIVPRYRPGDVCYVGLPHLRDGPDEYGTIQIWVPLSRRCFVADGDWVGEEAWEPFASARRMAGRFLPRWAATQFALVLSAGPQVLRDITEAQAVAELVERLPYVRMNGEHWWRRYWTESGLPLSEVAACHDPVESYHSMLAAVHHKPVPLDTWMWAYRFRIVKEPK